MARLKGLPSQNKVQKSCTLSQEVAKFLDNFPDGERNQIVNDILMKAIKEHKSLAKSKGENQ